MYPLNWEIELETVDMFGRPTETVGQCDREGKERLPFVICLLVINFFAIAFAMLQAWKTRSMSTEFSESRYIAIVMVSILLVSFVGCPVLVLAYGNPDATIFVANSIVFLTCCSTLLWIFVPKIRYQMKPPDLTRNSCVMFGKRSGTGSGERFFEVQEEEISSGYNEEVYGTRVTTKHTLEELEKEVRSLRILLSQRQQNHPSSGEPSSSRVSQSPSSVYDLNDLQEATTEVEEPSTAPSNGEGSTGSLHPPIDDK
jgi:hypothetical protein